MLSFLSACTTNQPLKSVEFIDPERFVGEWYVIANIPYFAERNKVASKVIYQKLGEEKYADIFESRKNNFDAPLDRLVGKVRSMNENNTRWKSTFYWVVNFSFDIIDIDPEYQIMLLAHPSREYGWVMARQQRISDQEYQRAMQIFKQNNYDTSLFSKVPQFPDDIGKAGFQNQK